jgi:phospholipid/cholesterol/gamma-HCH transport system ATP-binding protein
LPLIELKHLHKRFGRLIVLNDVSLTVEKGESLVIIGASGAGKSVILKHIVGLLKPDRGEVWFAGHRIDELTERELMVVRRRFGFLFQMGALFDSLNVNDNVGFPLVEHTKKSQAEIRELVKQKLAMVGLREIGAKMPGQLSGGQRARAGHRSRSGSDLVR